MVRKKVVESTNERASKVCERERNEPAVGIYGHRKKKEKKKKN
jgi:hypothetical protein